MTNQLEGNNDMSEQVIIVPVLYRVEEAAEAMRLSRDKVYELIRSGQLRSVKVGRSRRVPVGRRRRVRREAL